MNRDTAPPDPLLVHQNLESQADTKAVSLKAGEERYRELFEGMSSGVAVYEAVPAGADFIIKEFNPAAERTTHTRREDVVGRLVSEVFPQVKAFGLFEVFQRVWKTGVPERHPNALYQDNKVSFWAENYVYRLPSGEVVAIFDDLTERKQAEESLRRYNSLLRATLESTADGILVVDLQGRIVDFNQQFARLWNLPPELVVTGQSRDLITSIPDHEAMKMVLGQLKDPERFVARVEELYTQPETASFDVIEFKDGRVFERYSFPQRTEGRPTGRVWSFRDVTDRERSHAALRESEEKYRLLVENAGEAIVVIQADRIRFVNRKGQDLIGYSADELGHRSFLDFIHPEDRAMVEERHRARVQGLAVSPEYSFRIINRQGEARWIELRVVVIQWEGEPATLNFMADITARKRAEEAQEKLQAQLVQAQKMESVGRLAGGVAHDFNNMLQAILGNVCEVLADLPPDSTSRENLEEIKKCAQRSADLTRQLLAFARKQTVKPEVLDLNSVVESLLKMMRRLIGEDVQLVWRPGMGLWPVKIDPSQINQVLANLCVNARDSIREQGHIFIETGKIVIDAHRLAGQPDFVPGDYVLLAVSDDGLGMEKEVIEHLFEPFFTTKEIGRGTGLGLATVYGIIKQNHGFVEVQSEPGRGTSFKIYLPRCVEQVQPLPREEAIPKAADRAETVLLVEDEPAVLRTGQRMLQDLGYVVVTANSPAEALRLAQAHAGEIHLLITDVVMPEMNGRDLAQRLLSIHPHLKSLYMSGHTTEIIAHHGWLNDGLTFLQKPFTTQALAETVRQILDQK